MAVLGMEKCSAVYFVKFMVGLLGRLLDSRVLFLFFDVPSPP